ncbi:hypothetical protein JAAARDRAFT_164666 [Jaapia argillacea MUCL 33604]|uniref:3-dehydrosphinganine reductase n=1 Tax=Jaapia argillacea MUCL 33604 TaxID=933084 RepID=A0A067PHV8_9AGAM|nr:hypothetical protein JAAARDRAFT_164666 [Jaapia argillacea MUCL 33604]
MPFWSWGKNKWNPDGKHCYVTGGSVGLGLALATILASRGAHVSIVARGKQRLADAIEVIESHRQRPDQIFRSFSFDLCSAEGAEAALDAVVADHEGLTPDAIFLCAGVATPRFFVESTAKDLIDGMNLGYWTEAWTSWAVTRRMVQQGRQGKIVFIASTLCYMTFVGWSSYSPARHAVRGLADTLRSELQLYNIDVHLFSPNTMLTPGYDEEQKTKPKITLKIEEGDTPLTAEQAAIGLIKGIEANHAHISADFITELFRASTRGSAPGHNFVYDWALDMMAMIGAPIWRSSVDTLIRAHRAEHAEYLQTNGVLSTHGDPGPTVK